MRSRPETLMIPPSSFPRPEIMSQVSDTFTEPSLDTQPHQDVSSSVNEYLSLINHNSQTSRLGSDHPSHRNAVFKDIKVWGSNSESESEFLETVTNIFLLPLTLIHKAFSQKKPVDKMILHGINGFVNEGEMLLALGRPGSGCTTLFKTLAGFTGTFHGWSGEANYFGVNIEEVKKGFRGDLVYNSEGIFLSTTIGEPRTDTRHFRRCPLSHPHSPEHTWVRSPNKNIHRGNHTFS